MSVSLRDVVLAVSYGDASLVGESAGYLILGAADGALRGCERGCLDSVTIDEEGSVRLKGVPCDEDEAERALRRLLGVLLGKVRIPSNNLARVAARRDVRGLRGLVAELEAALVPVNRRAARRTLARLCREAQKSAAREHAFAEVEEIEVEEEPVMPAPAPLEDFSPQPEAVEFAPAPAPVEAQSVGQGARAEHMLTVSVRREKELPGLARRPHPALLERLAGSYGARTPIEGSLSVGARPLDAPSEAGARHSAAEVSPDQTEVVDELDDAETQVFLSVAPVSEGARSARPIAPSLKSVYPARRQPATARPRRVLSDDDALIVMSESSPRRVASDIEDLLNKMSVAPTSTEELYAGLKALSRIDLSPALPPVSAK